MPWQFWLGLILGVFVGGLIGFAVGRLLGASAAADAAAGKLVAAEKKADEARADVDAQLEKDRQRAPSMRGRELEKELNDAFDPDKTPPFGTATGPLRGPDGK